MQIRNQMQKGFNTLQNSVTEMGYIDGKHRGSKISWDCRFKFMLAAKNNTF
jgi:hypothetical protein